MKKPTKPAAEAKPQMIRCGNNSDGCGREMRILKVHVDSQQIEAENYNPAAHLCLPCCNKLAYDWQIAFDDVDFLMVAKHNARAGKMGQDGTTDEVMALLRKMGVKILERKSYQRPASQAAVPVGDR